MRAVILNGVGTLTAEGEFQPVTGQQGAVLAALVAAFPGSVSFDELIDSLWRGRPTKTARNGLSVVVNRLRPKLVDEGLGLVTEGHNYRLDATAEDVDLHAFYSEVEQARAASAAAEHERARELLDVALSRWRGEPFRPHLDIDRVAVEAARAAGVRADAEEILAATLLELHEPESAASLATELTVAEPLREYRWELLMRALYRSGRGAEALRAYDRVTEILRSELGIDPGPSLTELHLAILNNDVALDPRATAASGWTHRPRIEHRAHIAGPATSFVGRENELKALESLFRARRLVTILGPGGAGKTRLAREYVGLRPDDPPLWIELAAVDSDGVVGLLNGHFERRDGTGDDARTLAESLRTWAGIIVFDNCEHVIDTIAPIAEAIAQACPDVRILATSRVALGTESEARLDAPALDDAAAIDLVLDRTFGAGPSPDIDDDDLLALVRQVDALPLALELVAGLLRHRSPTSITERLSDSISDLTAPRRWELRHRDLAETIDWSLDLLPHDVAQTFDRVAVMNGPFHGSDASMLLRSDVESNLSHLADSSLLAVVGDGERRQFRMLETMRVHARSRLEERGELDGYLNRHSCTFARIAVDVAALPGDTSGAIEARLDQFRAAFRHASRMDDVTSMMDLVRSLNPYFIQHRMFSEAQWIVDLASHREFGSLPDHFELRARAAYAAWFVGDFPRVEELLDEIRAEAADTGRDLPCLVHNVEFRVAANRRDIETAATALLAWVDAARTQGDANEVFESMSALAAGSVQTEHYDNADACAAETMRLAVEKGSEGWLAAAHYTSAYVDYARRAASGSTDLEDALRGFVEGRRLAMSSGVGAVAGWCDDMATACLRRMGRLDEAKELVIRTLRRWEARPASTHLGLNQVLRELVLILHADGRVTDAEQVSQARRSLAVSSLLCPADEREVERVESDLGRGTAPTGADPIKVALGVLR